MKNLRLKTKLYLVGMSVFLFILFCVGFWAYVANTVKGQAAGHEGLESILTRCSILFWSVCAIYLILLMGYLIWTARGVYAPLQLAEAALEKISKGDFSRKINSDAFGMEEEFCSLAGKMDQMRSSICMLLMNVKKDSEGISKAVGGICSSVSGLSKEMEAVFDTTESLSSSMEKSSLAAEEIKKFSLDIMESVKHVVLRAQDGSGWAKDIKERASWAKDTASENREAIRQNKKEIKESLARTLKDALIIEQVTALAESLMQMTEETNLLSLNAGMEAARMGEPGERFAATAEEIRSLADQSKKIVENMQWIIGEVGSAVANLNKEIGQLMEFVDTELYSSFNFFVRVADTYNSDAGEMSFLATDFGATAEELLASANGILEAIEQIRGTMEDSTANSAEIAEKAVRAAARTDSLSKGFAETEHALRQMKEGVGHFKVHGI